PMPAEDTPPITSATTAHCAAMDMILGWIRPMRDPPLLRVLRRERAGPRIRCSLVTRSPLPLRSRAGRSSRQAEDESSVLSCQETHEALTVPPALYADRNRGVR